MSNQIPAKQTDFENLLLTADERAGLNNAPTISAVDPPALQSDLSSISGGTILTPSIGSVDLFVNCDNPSFTSSSEITIDRDSTVDKTAKLGAPVRYSTDGINWFYGIIVGKVVQTSTLDLTISGVAMTAPITAVFQIGSANLLVVKEIFIPGILTEDDDQIDTVNNNELLWASVSAYLIHASAKVKTASVGDDLLINIAFGNVANNVTLSDMDLGQSDTRVYSGVDIDPSNYNIEFQDKIFVKVNQPSGVLGSNLTLTLIFVIDAVKIEQFIPLAAPGSPYGYHFSGFTGTSNTTTSGHINVIEYFSMSVDTGDSTDRGDDTVSRGYNGCVYDAFRTFSCDGSGASVYNILAFINTPSLSGDAVDRGDDILARRYVGGVSGNEYGHIIGGANSSSTTSSGEISSFLLPTATGDAADRGDLLLSNSMGTTCFNNTKGIYGGGVTGSAIGSTFTNVIQQININAIIGSSLDRGDLILAAKQMAGVSDIANDDGYFLGGSTGSTMSSGNSNIQSIDLSLGTGDAVSRGTLNQASGGAVGNSGEFIGYINNGYGSAGITNLVEKFTYGTGTITSSNRGMSVLGSHNGGGNL